MSFDKVISQTTIKYMRKGGTFAILVVILLLCLDFYSVINLENIPISNFELFLWLYLILNAGIATPLSYFKEKNNPLCPKCSNILRIEPSFYCENCGRIEFKGENK